MSRIRREPCVACPYRVDVPSGVWSREEYEKLPPYDATTGEQPLAGFACHATPEHYCHGWAVVHSSQGHDRELLALRFFAPGEEVPEPGVPLFASGQDAHDHGVRDIDDPSDEARDAVARLLRKYERLQGEDE